METENKKILLVEDDPNFGTVLKDYLAMNDYNVTHAKNGMEGFEKFKKDDFDLCILDVMMPYKDGFTLAKEIREKNVREHKPPPYRSRLCKPSAASPPEGSSS